MEPRTLSVIGAGFFGKTLLSIAKQQGWHTFASSTTSGEALSNLCDREVRYTSRDPTTKTHLTPLLDGTQLVVVCVAPHAEDRTDIAAYRTTYLNVLIDLQEAFRNVALPPTMMALISSTSVYGDHGGQLVTEDTPPSPSLSATQKVLLESERLFQCIQPVEHKVILRCGELTGDINPSPRNLRHRIRGFSGKTVPGTGSAVTNITHVEDAALATLFLHEHMLSGIFNVVSDLHMPRRELYASVLEQEGLPPPLWDGQLHQPFSDSKTVSSRKLQKHGFHFRHPLYPYSE